VVAEGVDMAAIIITLRKFHVSAELKNAFANNKERLGQLAFPNYDGI
jgi:hypothetical protein